MVARQFRVLEAWSSNLHTSTKRTGYALRHTLFFPFDRRCVQFESIRAYARRSSHAPSEDLKACFQGERREHLRPRRIPPHKTARRGCPSLFLSTCSIRIHSCVCTKEVAYSARRSASLFARRRARVSSPSANTSTIDTPRGCPSLFLFVNFNCNCFAQSFKG